MRSKVSAGFHSRHFYSTIVAVATFRALGVGYVTRENPYAEDRTLGSVASLVASFACFFATPRLRTAGLGMSMLVSGQVL